MESKERQVIIFTHDLSFLMRLQDFCSKYDSEINIKSIERIGTESGIYTDNMPWDAMNVKKRIKKLKEKYNELKKIYKNILGSEYRKEASLIYNLLRETWERLVEELLLNGVVYRFDRDIQTKRLKKVTDISDDDYKKVADAMDKCSFFTGHDKSPELNEDIPDPNEIMNDIEEIEKYKRELNKRNRDSSR